MSVSILAGIAIKSQIENENNSLSSNQLSSQAASMLFDKLRTSNSSIKEVFLSNNKHVDDTCMKSLGEYIKFNKFVEKVSLEQTETSDTGIETLTPYLVGNNTLKGLFFNECKRVTDKSISFLLNMVEASCVGKLGLDDTSVTNMNALYVPLACNLVKMGSAKFDFSER